MGTRRALSSLQRPVRRSGEQRWAAALFEALDQAASEDADTLTHGFHAYPARLHPAVASTLLDAWPFEGASGAASTPHVVDPFCGSGTVLVEARRRGFSSTGVDLNPVALRVARVKADVRDAASREAFTARLDDVVARSKERVRARAPGRAPVSKAQAERFEGHVLRELAGLYAEIEAVDDERDRRALEVVLSAIVVKVSKQRADTDEREAAGRRIGRFVPTEIFHKKGAELVERWAALAAACPARSPAPELFLDDARRLPRVLSSKADIVITSPPYAGTYDYARHHALRAPWLGVDTRPMRDEIGARRTLTGAGARARWDQEVLDVLCALAASLAPKGAVFLVVGDGEIGGARVRANEHLASLAPGAGLVVTATASAPRPDWRGGAPREEHIVALAHGARRRPARHTGG